MSAKATKKQTQANVQDNVQDNAQDNAQDNVQDNAQVSTPIAKQKNLIMELRSQFLDYNIALEGYRVALQKAESEFNFCHNIAVGAEKQALAEPNNAELANNDLLASKARARAKKIMVECEKNVAKTSAKIVAQKEKVQKAIERLQELEESVAKKDAQKASKELEALENAQKEMEAARLEIENRKQALQTRASTNEPKTDKNGNIIVETALDSGMVAVMNMIADGLDATMSNETFTLTGAVLPKLSLKQLTAMNRAVAEGYVTKLSKDTFVLTNKGLEVFGVTVDDLEENYLKALAELS